MNLPTWCPDWSGTITMANMRMPILWDETFMTQPISRFQASKTATGKWAFTKGEFHKQSDENPSLHVQALLIGSVRIGSLPTDGSGNDDMIFENLLDSWSQLVAKYRPLNEEVLQELEKTAKIDDRGYADVTSQRNTIYAFNYFHLKLNALRGGRRFVVTEDGVMGMAPPHVEEGDMACVIIGSRVPYILRKAADFYTLVGELYLSDGFMFGKAIDMMENGEIIPQDIEIR